MKKIVFITLGMAVGLSLSLFAGKGKDDVKPIDSTKITVKSAVTYSYEAKLPDGSVKKIETLSAMSDKQIQEQAAAIYDSEQVKLKEIETKSEALTYKGVIIEYKEWVLYGKVISYDYRYRLPDGTTNWINSKVPLKEANILTKVKASYKNKLKEDLNVN